MVDGYNRGVSEAIFSVSGLRGIAGRGLTAELVSRVTEVFCRLYGPGGFALGRDPRPSGSWIKDVVQKVLSEFRCQVFELGICPTPTAVHFVRQRGLKGGLVITASHNPIEWNGLKLVHPAGRFLFADEVAALDRLMAEGSADSLYCCAGSEGGVVSEAGAVDAHIAAIRRHPLFAGISAGGLRIGVDAVNGAMSGAAAALLRAFGAEPVTINCEPEKLSRGFPRGPEPVPGNLTALCQLVQAERLDAGFAFDPDGDRFSCVDENGVPLGEEATLGLAALFVLAQRKTDVVVNLSTSRMVDSIAERFGVRVLRTPVGEANVVRKMLETGAVLGGEGNGGVIFPEINSTRDGLVAAAAVLGLMRKSGKSLGAIRQELPEYHQVKSAVQAREFDVERLISNLERYRGKVPIVDRSDGIRIDGGDWWVHIRKSNTEPAVRIIAEARSRMLAEDLVGQVRQLLEKGG
uniref:Phosphoglucosamine mutase n=3 Tax=candidate division WOR-3 bacterium TaxID=2052148 RepID=A0A7C3IMQ2_UNCW3